MTLLNFKPTVPDGMPRSREERSKEKIFLEHYAWLAECAFNITYGQRERAEDLVHDAYLQFLEKDLDLASIGDVRGYLNGILRHLHLLQLRRTTRHPVQSLSLLDHDSALVGLRAGGSVDQLQSVDLLVRACDFACYRKETSVTASILILRFFHGYFPEEIALLLRARRRTVDQWIQRGRSEIKQYIESPYPLPEGNGRGRQMPTAATPNACLRLLRERVFDSCTTGCSVLVGCGEELGVAGVAHLVSCQTCLDGRSRKAGLSHVAERMADDISDRDDGRPQGGGASSRGILPIQSQRKSSKSKRALMRSLHARRQERFEHHPKEISLAFDGQIHATMIVNAPSNTLSLSLGAKEVPDSIAILSEQEFYFLILDRSELMGSERKVHQVALSGGRWLQISITLETLGPSLQLVYEDPRFSEKSLEFESAEVHALTAEPILRFASIDTKAASSVASRLRVTFQGLIRAMNPLLTSAIVLVALATVCFVLWLRSAPTLSVAELLDHARKSDRAAVSDKRPGVIYQKVSIRTKRRTFEHTVYRDAQGIRRPRRRQLTAQDEQLKNELTSAGVNWDAPLSAADFAAWRQHLPAAQDVVTLPAAHLLTLTTTPKGNGSVIRETLTLRDTDFHAVGRTIDLRDTGTVEIAELNYDVLPWSAANQGWFEPLAGATISDVPAIHAAAHLPHLLSALELEEAELQARIALNQLQADAGERIRLTRGVQGIEIKGVVDTNVRRRELVARLTQIPHVQTSILSVEELDNQPHPAPALDPSQPLQVYSVEAQSSPLERYLREKQQPLDQLATISQNLLDGALQMQQAQVHFSELQPSFAGMNELPRDMQRQLGALSHSYLDKIGDGFESNRRTLRSLGFEDGSAPSPESNSVDDLSQQIHRYRELCQELITNGTEQTRSAVLIAHELTNLGTRIKLRVAQLSATVPQVHD